MTRSQLRTTRGRRSLQRRPLFISLKQLEALMDGIVYLVGLIVIVMAILSFFGLR